MTERLWTPWRMHYVAGTRQPGCVFCNAIAGEDDPAALVLLRRERCYAILNRFPYNSGHSMIVPNSHAAGLDDLDPETRAEMFELATLVVEVSRAVLACEGFNLGLNLGEIAGAGIAQHLHMHVVPRWTGDTNFMPILADTVVLPELLPVTYARLRAELERVVATREHGAIAQAGALVILPDRAAVVLRRTETGDIVLPKGHIEPGETAADAAMREVLEETGVAPTLAGWAGSHSFEQVEDAALHHVSFLLATGSSTAAFDQHLETDTLLVSIDAAADAVTIPDLARLIRSNLPHLHRIANGSE